VTEKNSSLRRRGIYLLPNLFTTGALFAGFYSIVSAIHGDYNTSALAIFIAMVLDNMDGRVARLTHTQSEFGAQYDSLADMVSFGLAPALLMYQWSLSGLGKPGWLAAFIYAAFAALRLARFNTQVATADKAYFQGLASPAAAALLAGLVWVSESYGAGGKNIALFSFALTLIAAFLMVSNIRYRSFKDLDIKRVPFITALTVMLVFVLVTLDPPQVLFGAALLYALSGPVLTFFALRARRARRRERTHSEDNSSADPPDNSST
jgi:CDP-diacylglycerol---serine O-phosphatidyltransferase